MAEQPRRSVFTSRGMQAKPRKAPITARTTLPANANVSATVNMLFQGVMGAYGYDLDPKRLQVFPLHRCHSIPPALRMPKTLSALFSLHILMSNCAQKNHFLVNPLIVTVSAENQANLILLHDPTRIPVARCASRAQFCANELVARLRGHGRVE